MIARIINKSYSVFLAASLILFFFYHKVLLNINSIVFSGKGDGLKNYYTYIFHAKHDKNFWDFSGMNYPFYEHIVYTDAHPLLSYLIGRLDLVDYGIGILNFMMLISYPISAIFIYKILKYYKVDTLWSFVSSLVICFMAPQLFRLTGHLSLSYVFAIPLMWYMLIKLSDHRHFKWTVYIFILLFAFFFTHPYLGLILAVFGLIYAGVFWLFNRKDWLFYGLRIVLPILLSIVLFQILVSITDTHVDRMKTPAGFYDYYANWNSLLVPHHGPMNAVKQALGFKVSSWESWSYIGLATIVYMIIGLVYFGKYRKEISLKMLAKSPIGKLYIVGHLVLLFSFCFPLKYDFMHWVVEVLGPLKQFRVLGRFTWVYFYIVSISGVILLVHLRARSYHKLRWDIIFYSGILFTILEFYPAHTGVAKSIAETDNPFQKENLSKDLFDIIEWSNTKEFDAILFLPFTHLSSENIFMLGGEKSSADGMLLSYHTNTPLLNTITSRNSVSESILFQNLFSPEFVDKTLLYKIGYDKKIMLIKNKDGLDHNELRMLWTSEKIYQNETYSVYEFSFDRWNSPDYFNALKERHANAVYDLGDGWYSDTTNVWFTYDSFDQLSEVNSMVGTGALAGQKTGINLIKSKILGLENDSYTCSFWYNIRVDRADQLAVIEQKYFDGTGKWVAQTSIRETNLIVGDWAYVEMEFEITDEVEETKLFLSGNHSKKWFVVDELLIRKTKDNPIFKKGVLNNEAYMIYNNFWLKEESFSK